MKFLFKWLLASIHTWLNLRCKHEDATYDILEGERGFEQPVTWCRCCGAVKIAPSNEWRVARPDWSLEPL
jgi:hypothetical protein